MTVLVTGASGFVGSAVVRRLLAEKMPVRVMLRPESDRRNIEGLDVETVIGDLLDKPSLQAAIKGCDSLFHVAADYRLWAPDPKLIYRANVDGSVNLMQAALNANIQRVVYTSSVATLGLNSDRSPANEDTPVSESDMIGPYKHSKYLAEERIQSLIKKEGLPAVIVSPSTPIGPRDIKPTPTGKLIVDALNGKMPAYVDTGLNLVHVDDVAEGHWLAYTKGRVGERYILGHQDMTLEQILMEIAAITGGRPPRVKIPHLIPYIVAWCAETWVRFRRQGEPIVSIDSVKMAKKYMFFSNAKARVELGFSPRPAREALEDAIYWFQQHS